jgi:hypothetical protein
VTSIDKRLPAVTFGQVGRLAVMGKLIDKLKTLLFFKLTTIYVRYMIGFAFVFASFVKIKGERFTSIPATEPVGYFFEAMYQSGFYWNFLGWSQLIAGSLLMTQRFASFGALVFFPIILNVFMITHSVDFGSGTPVITSLMLLGTVYLIAWDYKRWTVFFRPDHKVKLDFTKQPEDEFMTSKVWSITGCVFVVLSAYPWLFAYKNFVIWVFAMLAVGIAAFFIGMFEYRKKTKLSLKSI